MVVVSRAPSLSSSDLQVFHTIDPYLSSSPILVLFGPSATASSTSSSLSRIQSHVFAPSGFQSYHKLSMSPASPLYAAVNCLPREEQGDEILRAVAFSIYKYFGELSEVAKDAWVKRYLKGSESTAPVRLFSAQHAASLASRMTPVVESQRVLRQLEESLQTRVVSNIDLDVVLPPGTIRVSQQRENGQDSHEDQTTDSKYGSYGPLVELFGETLFLPTKTVRRAPSRHTAVNRSTTFTKKQKENLRREINELVDTEDSYIEKLNELLVDVAGELRKKTLTTISSQDARSLENLFPPCLNSILVANSGFFDAVRAAADETEDRAIQDIASTPDSSLAPRLTLEMDNADGTGVVRLAETLLEWLPRFQECYSDYIQAHTKVGPLLRDLAHDPSSSIGRMLQEVGEQRLLSLLIEPVQRLPRYNLYIDNIAKQLPVRHSVLKLLLRAKDVVASICDTNVSPSDLTCLTKTRSIVPSWPSIFRPQGRFITAIDAAEINARGASQSELLLVLFAGHLVLIRKQGDNALSARSFVAEVQKSGTTYLQSETGGSGLFFLGHMSLEDYSFSHTEDNTCFTLVPVKAPSRRKLVSPNADCIRHFRLSGTSEGRAQRWLADVIKAQLEGRFSEEDRDGPRWEARLLDNPQYDVGLLAAIFEDGQRDDRGSPAAVRVMLDEGKGLKRIMPSQDGAEIVVSVCDEGQGFYRLDIEAQNERGTRDRVTIAEFLPVMIKRLSTLLQMRNQIRNPAITSYLLQHYAQILQSLELVAERSERAGTTRTRSRSPTKLLSSLFGNISLSDRQALSEATASSRPPQLGHVPRLAPTQRHPQSVSSPEPASKENAVPHKVALVAEKKAGLDPDSIEKLEDALSCYLLALKARKGNIVGSVIARRSMADESVVNELYNALLENSNGHERAAQASVDLIFAAFERFMHVAWRQKLGPVIPPPMLSVLQSKMGVLNTFDYDEFEEEQLANLAPQNRRALKSIIGTLADLLDGTRNDGDRGALTAAFAEVVVYDEEPQAFIPLIDRFVDNQVGPLDGSHASGLLSVPESVSSTMTIGTTKNGSISSKASSLSRRLGLASGFGSLRRDNSKRKQDKALPPDPPTAKPSFSRSQSQDAETRMAGLSRPGSSSGDSRPGTAHSDHEPSVSLATVSPMKRSGASARKKRRSSLSDLTILQTPTATASPFWTHSATKKVEDLFQGGSSNHVTPSRLALPGITPVKSASVRNQSPVRNENTPPQGLPQRSQTVRELSPARYGTNSYRLPPVPAMTASTFTPFDENRPPKRESPSRLATRGPLSERVASGNTPPPLKLSPEKQQDDDLSPPRKESRTQSATKLADRVATHQTAVESTSSTLQEELAKIGQELAALSAAEGRHAAPSNSAPQSSTPLASIDATTSLELTNFTNRLRALENRCTHLTSTLTTTNLTLSEDVTKALAAERRAKELDKQLQRADAENDVLYSRMNEEIMKVFQQVRGGDGVEALRRQLREKNEEAERWKRECGRLRRENAGLKA